MVRTFAFTADGQNINELTPKFQFVLAPLTATAVFFTILLASLPAVALPGMCDERDKVLARLAGQYKEAPSAIGIANNGTLLELLTTADGSSWTLVMSLPNGASCLVAAGKDWTPVKHVVQGPEL